MGRKGFHEARELSASSVNEWASWSSSGTSAQVIDGDLLLTLCDQEIWFS
jgi:hypothetical protein